MIRSLTFIKNCLHLKKKKYNFKKISVIIEQKFLRNNTILFKKNKSIVISFKKKKNNIFIFKKNLKSNDKH